MYYEKEEHTRRGHSNPLCRISVVAVTEDSNEYKQAIYRSNSIILESQLYKEKEEEEFWRGWEEAGRPKLRCSKPEEKKLRCDNTECNGGRKFQIRDSMFCSPRCGNIHFNLSRCDEEYWPNEEQD